jgi:hypothetical protein
MTLKEHHVFDVRLIAALLILCGYLMLLIFSRLTLRQIAPRLGLVPVLPRFGVFRTSVRLPRDDSTVTREKTRRESP